MLESLDAVRLCSCIFLLYHFDTCYTLYCICTAVTIEIVDEITFRAHPNTLISILFASFHLYFACFFLFCFSLCRSIYVRANTKKKTTIPSSMKSGEEDSEGNAREIFKNRQTNIESYVKNANN